MFRWIECGTRLVFFLVACIGGGARTPGPSIESGDFRKMVKCGKQMPKVLGAVPRAPTARTSIVLPAGVDVKTEKITGVQNQLRVISSSMNTHIQEVVWNQGDGEDFRSFIDIIRENVEGSEDKAVVQLNDPFGGFDIHLLGGVRLLFGGDLPLPGGNKESLVPLTRTLELLVGLSARHMTTLPTKLRFLVPGVENDDILIMDAPNESIPEEVSVFESINVGKPLAFDLQVDLVPKEAVLKQGKSLELRCIEDGSQISIRCDEHGSGYVNPPSGCGTCGYAPEILGAVQLPNDGWAVGPKELMTWGDYAVFHCNSSASGVTAKEREGLEDVRAQAITIWHWKNSPKETALQALIRVLDSATNIGSMNEMFDSGVVVVRHSAFVLTSGSYPEVAAGHVLLYGGDLPLDGEANSPVPDWHLDKAIEALKQLAQTEKPGGAFSLRMQTSHRHWSREMSRSPEANVRVRCGDGGQFEILGACLAPQQAKEAPGLQPQPDSRMPGGDKTRGIHDDVTGYKIMVAVCFALLLFCIFGRAYLTRRTAQQQEKAILSARRPMLEEHGVEISGLSEQAVDAGQGQPLRSQRVSQDSEDNEPVADVGL